MSDTYYNSSLTGDEIESALVFADGASKVNGILAASAGEAKAYEPAQTITSSTSNIPSTAAVKNYAVAAPAAEGTVGQVLATDGVGGRYWKTVSGGGGGSTSDYDELENKPKINSVELVGDKALSDLGIQPTLTAGANITISGNIISSEAGASDAEEVTYDSTLTTHTAGSVGEALASQSEAIENKIGFLNYANAKSVTHANGIEIASGGTATYTYTATSNGVLFGRDFYTFTNTAYIKYYINSSYIAAAQTSTTSRRASLPQFILKAGDIVTINVEVSGALTLYLYSTFVPFFN